LWEIRDEEINSNNNKNPSNGKKSTKDSSNQNEAEDEKFFDLN